MDEWIKKDSIFTGSVSDSKHPLRGFPMIQKGKKREFDFNSWKVLAGMINGVLCKLLKKVRRRALTMRTIRRAK